MITHIKIEEVDVNANRNTIYKLVQHLGQDLSLYQSKIVVMNRNSFALKNTKLSNSYLIDTFEKLGCEIKLIKS